MLWPGVGEAFRVTGIGRIEHLLPLADNISSHSVVQHFRGQQGDPAVMMFVVVPGKERQAKGTCVLDGAEALRKLGPVLEGFELAFRVRIVVRDVRSAMRFGYAQISHQQRHRLGSHRGSPVGVDGESAGNDALFLACVGDQTLGQVRFFPPKSKVVEAAILLGRGMPAGEL